MSTVHFAASQDSSGGTASSQPGNDAKKGDSDPEQDSDPEGDVKTVLVVDDNVSVRRVAAKVLQRGGYRVLEAGSGDAALQVAEEAEGNIDMLLTDVVMPRMNGRELSETLLGRYPDVRVLFMSAYTEDEIILQGVRVAEVNFINKPFTVDGLRQKVKQVLGTDD